MSRRIIITQEDMKKLKKLVDDEINDVKNKPHVIELETELKRAEIVDKNDLSYDVISMNSTVLMLLDDMEEEVSLVYPHETNLLTNNISILSPIGTAIIGYREGDVFEWAVPSGTTRIEVKKVLYQPESDEKAVMSAD